MGPRSTFPFLPTPAWLQTLRIVLGLYMTAHGAWRIHVGAVDDFGLFLTATGLPAGAVLAWAITIFECVAGPALAFGWFVRWLALCFVLEHMAGIVMVHAPRGWFTVGHQVGGAEYSVLLLLCFLLTAAAARDREAGCP